MIHAHVTFLYISALPVFGSVHVCNACMYVCMHACAARNGCIYIFLPW